MRTTPGPFRTIAAILLISCVVPPSFGEDEAPKVIPAAEARRHVGERCTVEMTVRASKNAAHRRTYYLDSEADFNDEKNFAVVIDHDDAEKFERAGVDDPADHYRGKTIRVTGKVIHEDEQVRIRVTDPEQIKLVEASKP